jgi:hypothetical protein
MRKVTIYACLNVSVSSGATRSSTSAGTAYAIGKEMRVRSQSNVMHFGVNPASPWGWTFRSRDYGAVRVTEFVTA